MSFATGNCVEGDLCQYLRGLPLRGAVVHSAAEVIGGLSGFPVRESTR
jgi:hypothetical protein